jgi:hypothetical protein
VSRPILTTATAGFPASDAWWLSQVYNPLAFLFSTFIPPAVKAADTSRLNTTTPTDDPDLSVTVAANTTYLVEGLILYTSPSVAPDLKFNLNAPTGATGYWTLLAPSSTSTADPDVIRTIATPPGATTRSYGVSTAATVFGAVLRGTVITSSTAGAVTVQWSQFALDASNAITLKAGSSLRLIVAQ